MAHHGAISVDNGHRVEISVSCAFEERNGQNDAQFSGEVGEVLDEGVAQERGCVLEVLWVLFLAEVGRGKELLQEDDIGALIGSLANEAVCFCLHTHQTGIHLRSAFISGAKRTKKWQKDV